MPEIAMLGAVTPVATSASNKPVANKGDKNFDQVFADKQQAQPENVDNTVNGTNPSALSQQSQNKENSPGQVGADRKDVGTEEPGTGNQQVECVEVDAPLEFGAAEGDVAGAEATDVQQALMTLMKALAGDEEIPVSDDEMTAFVTELVQQLDATDLHGAEVLAGIDLSALKDQLDLIDASDNPDGQMAALIAQMSEQLQSPPELQPQLNAANNTRSQTEKGGPLAQARNLLQQVASAAAPGTAQVTNTEVADQATTDGGLVDKVEEGESIDPRFAGLLTVRQGQKGGHDTPSKAASEKVVAQQPVQQQGQPTIDPDAEQVTDSAADLERVFSAEIGKLSQSGRIDASAQAQLAKAGVDGLIQHGQQMHNPQGGMFADSAKVMTSATVQLPSGLQVPETQIFDQVVTHISGSVNGESGRMVLRLNPAELGSLKLDVVVEGDEVRANIHAQNQQVQEVIERHLPQLRNALAEQGLKIEQFQVDIDKQQSGGSFDSFANQQQHQKNSERWTYEEVEEEDLVPLSQLMQSTGGGISLHA